MEIIGNLDNHIFRCVRNENGQFTLVFSEGGIARQYKMQTDQVKGKNLSQVIGVEYYSVLKPYYERAFNGEKVEFRGFLFDDRFFSITFTPLKKDDGGRVVEVIGIIQDITDAYKSDMENKKMTDVLNRIIEFNPYSIQILDAEGHHVRENKAFRELFKTIPDKKWSLLDDSEIEKGGLQERLQKILNGEVVQTPPIWYNAHHVDSKYPDNPICIGSVIFPVFLSNGELELIVIMHEDITARMDAQSALEKSEQRLKHLLSSNPAVIYTSDVRPPLRWTFISENVTNLTGYSPDDFLGSQTVWSDHLHPDDKADAIDALNSVFKSGHSRMEYRFQKKDGNYIWILDETKLVYGPSGKPFEMIGYLIDISSRKETDRQLIIAKERAEESDRLKSAFLANMSHEIRTPMNGIMGFTDLLKDPKLSSEEKEEYVGIIRQSGNRLLNIINDLINISKVEAGQMGVNISETNINEQLDNLFGSFESETKEKGLKLYVKKPCPNEQSVANTDREKLYAILTNMIKNAIKFTYEGSIEFGYEKKHGVFEFFVKDTGIGIGKENQKAVLDRFIQVDSGFDSGYEGAGLGLSISKAYIELLGGNIWIESELGEGSSFFFSIADIQNKPI